MSPSTGHKTAAEKYVNTIDKQTFQVVNRGDKILFLSLTYLYRQVPVQTTVHFADTLSVCLPEVCSHHYKCRWPLTQQFYWSQSQHH